MTSRPSSMKSVQTLLHLFPVGLYHGVEIGHCFRDVVGKAGEFLIMLYMLEPTDPTSEVFAGLAVATR
eukprot:11078194-Karenia_brevis.AAC.1